MFNTIALTIDVGVPALFTSIIGAVRIAAVRSGRISLRAHERFPHSASGGGHTIGRHVGKTEAPLRERLTRMVADATANGRSPVLR